MDAKKVYVIVGDGLSVAQVKDELKAEGYDFMFHFDKDPVAFAEADEVWVFGDYEDVPDYKIAVNLGKDIWYM